VPRIPYPDLDKASPEVREMLGRLPAPANIFNMMAHAQSCVKPVMKLGGTLLGKLELDPKLRELCLLHAVKLKGGEYEWVQHVPIARDLGCTEAQIAALDKGDDRAACFDAREKAALRFTREVVVTSVSPGAFGSSVLVKRRSAPPRPRTSWPVATISAVREPASSFSNATFPL